MRPSPARTIARTLSAGVLTAGTLALGVTVLPAAAADDAAIETELLRLVNAERAAAGLAPVVEDPTLAAGADAWSATLASTGTVAHDPSFTVADAAGWAENVGFVSAEDAATALHQALMASESHQANIFNAEYTVAGIGVTVVDGRTYVTQRFAAVTTTAVPRLTTVAAPEVAAVAEPPQAVAAPVAEAAPTAPTAPEAAPPAPEPAPAVVEWASVAAAPDAAPAPAPAFTAADAAAHTGGPPAWAPPPHAQGTPQRTRPEPPAHAPAHGRRR